jgi:hypothetical protein
MLLGEVSYIFYAGINAPTLKVSGKLTLIKLPKRNSGMYEDENSFSKSGVKLSKQRRSKKPSIYDEMDELEELEFEGRDYGSIDDLYDNDEEFDD